MKKPPIITKNGVDSVIKIEITAFDLLRDHPLVSKLKIIDSWVLKRSNVSGLFGNQLFEIE